MFHGKKIYFIFIKKFEFIIKKNNYKLSIKYILYKVYFMIKLIKTEIKCFLTFENTFLIIFHKLLLYF